MPFAGSELVGGSRVREFDRGSAGKFFLGEVMFRWLAVAVIAGYLAPSGTARGGATSPPSVWFVDSLIKVFPGDAPGTHSMRTPEFRGARNQHVAVQLAIRSSIRLPDLSVEVKALEGRDGRRISNVEVHHVGYVVVGSHTPDCPPEEVVGVAPGWY